MYCGHSCQTVVGKCCAMISVICLLLLVWNIPDTLDHMLRFFVTFIITDCTLGHAVFEERPSVVQSDNQRGVRTGPSSPMSDLPTTPSESSDASDQHPVESSLQQTVQRTEPQSEVMFSHSRNEELESCLCNTSVNA